MVVEEARAEKAAVEMEQKIYLLYSSSQAKVGRASDQTGQQANLGAELRRDVKELQAKGLELRCKVAAKKAAEAEEAAAAAAMAGSTAWRSKVYVLVSCCSLAR